jgi:hypothetical protein
MRKKKLLNSYIPKLFAISLLTGAVITGLFLSQKSQDIRRGAAPATTVYIDPQTQTLSPGQKFTAKVMISSTQNQIIGTDLVLQYDPKVMTISSIVPGSGISSFTTVIRNEIDARNGKITYSAFTFDKTKYVMGEGIETLLINGQINSKVRPTTSSISISSLTSVAGLGEDTSVLANTVGGSIIVYNPTPTPRPKNTPRPR